MFLTGNFQIVKTDEQDFDEILSIYNSNKVFLLNHTGTSVVDREWCAWDFNDTLNGGFSRYRIAEAGNGPAIGFLDAKVSEETYLSLLILHENWQGRGIGKEIYKGFEEYIRG